MVIQGVLAILGLVGLYYLYKYLFSSDVPSAILLSGKQDASKQTSVISFTKNELPPLYTGGEFAVSTWIQIQKLEGNNKSILRISCNDEYDALRMYLSGTSAQLMVRFTTDTASNKLTVNDGMLKDTNSVNFVNSTTNSAGVATQQLFTTLTGSQTGVVPNSCDVIEIDMQRWIHIVVSVNGMSGDVYMDGKLVRSCVLPNYVLFNKPTVYLFDNGNKEPVSQGFGGYISTTQMFGSALSPDIVYQMYMAGPEPITNFWQYITAFMNPSSAY